MSGNDWPNWDEVGIITIPRCRKWFCWSRRVEGVALRSDDSAMYLDYRCNKCGSKWWTYRTEIKGSWSRPMRKP